MYPYEIVLAKDAVSFGDMLNKLWAAGYHVVAAGGDPGVNWWAVMERETELPRKHIIIKLDDGTIFDWPVRVVLEPACNCGEE